MGSDIVTASMQCYRKQNDKDVERRDIYPKRLIITGRQFMNLLEVSFYRISIAMVIHTSVYNTARDS